MINFLIYTSNIESHKVSESVNKFYSTVLPIEQQHNIFQKPEEIPSKNGNILNYCSFFNNRAPSPQINLKNCTWYKENSCCLQSEITSTFSKVIQFFDLLIN